MKTKEWLLRFLFIVSFALLSSVELVKADDVHTVEGEWEVVSTSIDALQNEIGHRLLISKKDNAYEVKWLDNGATATYSGSEMRIVRTSLQDLGSNSVPGGSSIPSSVLRQAAGQKVPINDSYTVSDDGNFLQMACDYVWFYYTTKSERFDHYETEPGYIKKTLKRISTPPNLASPMVNTVVSDPVASVSSAVAQVESRGEFYFLTKDGRKLSGDDASKMLLEEGTKVVTGNDGHIKLTLPDNTTFTVGPNSDLVIDKFVYDPDRSPEKIMATMTKGVFRWVTGKTAQHNPAQMKVTLPVIAVGIRGTDFEATVESNGNGSVVLNFGQLEIIEKKTGFTFVMEAGQKITFGADGSVSRPMKVI